MGLISSVQQPQTQQPAQANPQQAQAAVQQLSGEIAKTVMAAQSILYGKDTFKHFEAELKNPDVIEGCVRIATMVISLLLRHSNNSINPKVVIPAGIFLVGDIMDMMDKVHNKTSGKADHEEAILRFCKEMKRIATGGE